MLTKVWGWRWKILIGLAVLFVAIQFVPLSVDNPSTRDEPAWDSARTRELVVRACADCHSNETKVLWFEHVAPIKWYIADHVKEGREALNFSEWHTNAGDDPDDAVETIEKGTMPLDSYTYFGLHGDANLTDEERQDLIDGLEATMAADPPTESERDSGSGSGDNSGSGDPGESDDDGR